MKRVMVFTLVTACTSILAQPVPEYVRVDFSRFPDGTSTNEGDALNDQFAHYGVWFSLDDALGYPIVVQEGAPPVALVGNGGEDDSPMPLDLRSGLTDPIGPGGFADFSAIRISFEPNPVSAVRLTRTIIDGMRPGIRFYHSNPPMFETHPGCQGTDFNTVQRPRVEFDALDDPPTTYLVTSVGQGDLLAGYALFNLRILRGPQPHLAGPFIRVSQESAPGAGDFDQNVLGCLRPRRNPMDLRQPINEFYQYDQEKSASFGGIRQSIPLLSSRSHVGFIEASEGLTMIVIHNEPRRCSNNSGGPPGHAEMTVAVAGAFRLSDDKLTITDDPSGGQDDYLLSEDGSTLRTTHTWYQDHTDGFAISGLEGDWSVVLSFADFDGDDGTLPFEGLDSWVATSTDGPPIELDLEADRRVQLTAVCLADTNLNCRVDLFDFSSFADCMNGPGQSVSKDCERFDVEQGPPDHDVDLHDFARFEAAFNGS